MIVRPVLDVLIPHYRDAEGLRLSLESVVAQTWDGAMRVVVVDDGSPAAEREAAEAVCETVLAGTGITLTFGANPQNLGRPATRNRLLDRVEADHVAWLDAGDVWYPEKLAVQFEHLTRLRQAGADLDRIWVTCRYDWDQKGRKLRTLRQTADGNQVTALLEGTQLRAYLWTLLGTRRAFAVAGRFDERLLRLQDLDYFLHFARAGGTIVTAPGRAPLCRYFKSDIGRNAVDVHQSYQVILAKHRPVIQTYSPAMASKLHYKADRLAARFAFSNEDWMAGTGYLTRAVLLHPLHASRVARNLLRRQIRGR